MRRIVRLTVCALVVLVSVPAAAQAQLEKVVIVTRHGIRAAMSSPERLESASKRPWPRFSVPAGHLTPHGAQASTLQGSYYRQLYAAQGLLAESDCKAVYYWANVTQRTIATAEALERGLTPGCPSNVHTVGGEEAVDPLFDPVRAGVAKSDPALLRAAVAGRVGGDLVAWSAAHRDTIERLDGLLMQCRKPPCKHAAGKRRIFDTPAAFEDGDETVGIAGPEAFASGITESLLMAWADGQDFTGLGWKGLDEDTLLRVFALHQAEFDLRLRTPAVAQVGAGHLAARLLDTLEDRPEGVGGPDAKIVVIVGHDGTLAMLGGLLGVDWVAPGYQPNQIAPGGALVFERWRRADGVRVVRVRYVVQTLSQLRSLTPLSLAGPPASSSIFVPGCSLAAEGYDCRLDGFARRIASALAR